jgi:hypothetical protein
VIVQFELTPEQRELLRPLAKIQSVEHKGLLLMTVSPNWDERWHLQVTFVRWPTARKILKLIGTS